MKKYILIVIAFACLNPVSFAQRGKKQNNNEVKSSPQTIENLVADMKKHEGFFNFYMNEETGKVLLEIDKMGKEFLYVNALAAGVGSNDIGLDRGQLGGRRVVKFERHGNKVLLIQPNQGYRAVSENIDEIKSVQEAFASSVLGGFKITKSEGSRVLVDITEFLLRDSHGISQRLKNTKQGSYSLDKNRSAVYAPNTMNFPQNSEFESILTFQGTPKGDWIRSVAPSADAITVRTHHSFIQLPDADYEMREFDPRSGYIHISFQDYATPIEESLIKRFVVRHRLKKKDPSAAISEAVEPIVYYLDRGAPEPIKSALIEGASWWNQAFEAAGFRNAFQVKVLPEGAHPLDVRYNVIQWVHRSTRGWSYGSSIVDPRTGEILKGHVSLGSLRVRQDFLIAEGLLNPYEDGGEVPTDMKEMALARLRQLSAHEVGHTIGLVHNFAASFNNRASVMDYPHPYVKMDDDGKIDLSEAYDTGIGDWDKVTIKYGYGEYNDISEAKKILDKANEDGFLHITDRDARPTSGAHPIGHLWDNGKSAAGELNRMMKIRRKVLDNFSEKSIREGKPFSSIEEVLVPMYLFHRYQVDGTSKVVGGLNYSYSLKGDNQVKAEFISPQDQKEALEALVNTLKPEALKLPEELLQMIPPKAHGYRRSRETFVSKTGPAFDYFAAVETASALPLSFLLNAARANRLETYKSRDVNQPGFQLVLDRITSETWKKPSSNSADRALQKIVEMQFVRGLMGLYNDANAYDQVKALTRRTLTQISELSKSKSGTSAKGSYYAYAHEQIKEFLDEPAEYSPKPLIKAPDGSPIGSTDTSILCSHGY